MLTLILPMGIGLAHAFHQHENIICLAENESHFHSEETNCDQLHYFSQTVNGGDFVETKIPVNELFVEKEYFSEFTLIHFFSKADPDRGPPIITV